MGRVVEFTGYEINRMLTLSRTMNPVEIADEMGRSTARVRVKLKEMGVPVTALGVAQHYCARYPGLVDYFVIDESDAGLAGEINERLARQIEMYGGRAKFLNFSSNISIVCLI